MIEETSNQRYGDLSVLAVIVNFNTTDDIEACVQSLLRAKVKEIRVLDNASTELDAVERLYSLQKRFTKTPAFETKFVASFSQENLGFGGGVNLLAEDCDQFDYIWIVNPDVSVEEDALKFLLSAMVQDGLAVASPVIETGTKDSVEIWFSGGQLRKQIGLTVHATNFPSVMSHGLSIKSSFLTGAAMCVRTDAWTMLGGFRSDLFLYWEDAEFVERAESNGFRCGTVIGSKVWHRVGASGGESGKSKVYYYYMNRNRLIVCGETALSRLNILLGRGFRYTVRLCASSIREADGSLLKTMYGLRGMISGLLFRSSRPQSRVGRV